MSAIINDMAHGCAMSAARDNVRGGMATIMWTLAVPLVVFAALATLCGCAYKGGKVIDGTNLAIGMKIPGTEWSINVLDYVGGCRIAGQDSTHIVVSNEVIETNRYFGVVETWRHSKMTADIEPLENGGGE